MKKIAVLLIVFVPLFGMAQKPVKPNTAKAEKAWRDKKLDEAKTIIDLTVASREFMKDKKGQPSKNAAEAWYVRGLIYISIDTTQNEKFKSLDPQPYAVAKASFDSCEAIDKGKTPSYIKDAKGFLPLTTDQVKSQLAQVYLNNSIDTYKKNKDYTKAFEYMERVLYFIPNDTSMLMNAGVYFGPAAKEDDKSIAYIKKYLAKGGKNPDAYIQLMSIYQDKKKDIESAIQVVKEAETKFPKNPDFPKYELNIYLVEKKYDLARKTIQRQLKSNPGEKETLYLLGQLDEELNNIDSAKIVYQKAVDMDPEYFDPIFKLAKLYYADGKAIKAERDKLGISAQDTKKRQELLMTLREKNKIALPYWEKCEKLKPEDDIVLFTLSDIYNNLVMDDQFDRVQKKIKALGLDK